METCEVVSLARTTQLGNTVSEIAKDGASGNRYKPEGGHSDSCAGVNGIQQENQSGHGHGGERN
jgi:hypothetical protein